MPADRDCATCALVGLDACPDHGLALTEDQQRIEDAYFAILNVQCRIEEQIEAGGDDPDPALFRELARVNECFLPVQLAYSMVPGHRRRVERHLAEQRVERGEAA